jgi:hypothetical protein
VHLIFEAVSEATTNSLLALLTNEERTRLLPVLRPVKLNQGDVIFDAGVKRNWKSLPANAAG